MLEGMGGLPDDISSLGILAGDGGSERPPWFFLLKSTFKGTL